MFLEGKFPVSIGGGKERQGETGRDRERLKSGACTKGERDARQCVISVRKTAEDASVVGGGDEGPNRVLLLFLHLLLQRGIDLCIVIVRKVGRGGGRCSRGMEDTLSLIICWGSSSSLDFVSFVKQNIKWILKITIEFQTIIFNIKNDKSVQC